MPASFPERRPPPWIGTWVPFGEMPIRRLKKRSEPRPPTENIPAFSRKNGRFSGNEMLKRVRLVWTSSTSTCAKSVL